MRKNERLIKKKKKKRKPRCTYWLQHWDQAVSSIMEVEIQWKNPTPMRPTYLLQGDWPLEE
jgi:hypothetical protein